MKSQNLKIRIGLTLTAVMMPCFFMGFHPAHAGFEWTPPPVGQSNAVNVSPNVMQPLVPALPVAPVSTNPVTSSDPMMVEPQDRPAIKTINLNGAPSSRIQEPVVPPSYTNMRGSGVIATPLPNRSDAPTKISPSNPNAMPQLYKVTEGFGKDIPLALALTQIVPPGYSFVFDSSVNKATRISWSGGKPWNEVLEDALDMYGMTPVISGRSVWIKDTSRYASQYDQYEQYGMQHSMDIPSMSPNLPKEDRVANIDWNKPAPRTARPDAIDMMMKSGKKTFAIDTNDEGDSYNDEPMPLTAETMSKMPPVSGARRNVPLNDTQQIAYGIPRPTSEPVVPGGTPYSPAPGLTMDPSVMRYWQAEEGQSLREVLTHWSNMSGVTIYWGADPNYVMPNSVKLNGTFEQAVQSALQGFSVNSEHRPVGQLYPNLPQGPSVLIVQNYPE